ncbi:MAG: exodeoxyribonuclease VII small subunit [Candidatus Faecousia sp.]|nr:exodeoxyribonuclease VII small subunit [Clostridiales bacterium]MDD6298160.1 exodeoxyribonuclease VII small subunit [Bacillota bacterium]MDD7341786.1 exodeoxyribonuclease VII small subunit [Bacillota bacterium]MDY2810120.1 exodeoxyribonuclease VII small subunit [Candidatus Faecousia sp.]
MNEENKTFEQNLRRLEEIVRAMERGDVALEESLRLFQEGTELVRSCGKLLDDAEQQVKLVLSGPDGEPVEEDFADGEP